MQVQVCKEKRKKEKNNKRKVSMTTGKALIRTYGLMRGKSHRRQRRGVGLYQDCQVKLDVVENDDGTATVKANVSMGSRGMVISIR